MEDFSSLAAMNTQGTQETQKTVEDMIEQNRKDIHLQLLSIVQLVNSKFASKNKNLTKADNGTITNLINEALVLVDTNSELATKNIMTNASKQFQSFLTQVQAVQLPTVTPKPLTFSQAVARNQGASFNAYVDENKAEDEQVLFFNAKQDIQPESVLTAVNEGMKQIRLKKPRTKIIQVTKTRRGALVKLPTSENIDELIQEFKQLDSVQSKSFISAQTKLDPLVVLKSVKKDMNPADLIPAMCNQNELLEGMENKLRLQYTIQSATSYNDLVLRVSPIAYEALQKSKQLNKGIFVGNQCVQIRDKVWVRQCQNCFKYDHPTRSCTAPKICARCGVTGAHDCPTIPSCVNCTAHPAHKNKDNRHMPNNYTCPLYKDKIDRIIKRTVYSGLDHDIPSRTRHATTSNATSSQNV